jgi:hypothetical protein
MSSKMQYKNRTKINLETTIMHYTSEIWYQIKKGISDKTKESSQYSE